ncbi:MAG: NAD-dependent epimerase [Myxococcales bacterium]|nr:NAD-dependent epimerase [Myxococcales bacterium]
MSAVLVTGVAGFIGYHVAERLLNEGREVVGLDIVNDYYDPKLKWARLNRLVGRPGFRFVQIDLADGEAMASLFAEVRPDVVIHLAAQAGVRYSLTNPHAYIQANLVGFTNILEGCRHSGVGHLVYASSSSVYGLHTDMPFTEHRGVDHPVSLYAATKKANELMAHAYSHIFRLPTTGLRFFTVYGPWGRPDMALFLFTRAILAGEPIDVYNQGRMERDFTYIDDIVTGVVGVSKVPATPNPAFDPKLPDPAMSSAPFRVLNIGNERPEPLLKMIAVLEQALGKAAVQNLMPLQPGDVPATWADVSDLAEVTGFQPATPIEVGIGRFVEWYRGYYGA